MKKYSGLKQVTVGLLFFLQNFHIEIKDILVSIMPDFFGLALIFIGLFRVKALSKRVRMELPIIAIDFLVNIFVFLLNLYISFLNSRDANIDSVYITTYSVLGVIKGVLSCFIIYSIFVIFTNLCVAEGVNKSVYSKCSICMWSYIILFFINIIFSVVILVFPEISFTMDWIIMIPNLFVSIWAVMLCVHMHDALIHKTHYHASDLPDEIKEIICKCDYENEHLHCDDL